MATEIATGFALPEISEAASPPRSGPGLQAGRNVWPKAAAVGLALAAWQVVVWSGWKPDYVLPGPAAVLGRRAEDLRHADFYVGVAITLRRPLIGHAIAVAIGSAVGILVARVSLLRTDAAPANFGLQSMASSVWYPLAILLLELSEGDIT